MSVRETCTRWRYQLRQLRRALKQSAQTFKQNAPRKHYLAGCLYFKNCAPYLAEWLEFHRIVGFEHFYLYNNSSDDNFREVLRPYLEHGIVTLHDLPSDAQQLQSYLHCARTYQAHARWIAFLDDDEFLFPAGGGDIRRYLERYETYPALVVAWLVFGSSGHLSTPSGLVIENYTRRGPNPAKQVKTIADPRRISNVWTPHTFKYHDNQLPVDENKASFSGIFAEHPTANKLRINHYFTKSKEHYRNKCLRGYTDGTQRVFGEEEWDELEKRHNRVEDLTIQQYLPKLKARLSGT